MASSPEKTSPSRLDPILTQILPGQPTSTPERNDWNNDGRADFLFRRLVSGEERDAVTGDVKRYYTTVSYSPVLNLPGKGSETFRWRWNKERAKRIAQETGITFLKAKDQYLLKGLRPFRAEAPCGAVRVKRTDGSEYAADTWAFTEESKAVVFYNSDRSAGYRIGDTLEIREGERLTRWMIQGFQYAIGENKRPINAAADAILRSVAAGGSGGLRCDKIASIDALEPSASARKRARRR